MRKLARKPVNGKHSGGLLRRTSPARGVSPWKAFISRRVGRRGIIGDAGLLTGVVQ